ncbi:LytR C-terminal domain-containing protein [Streptomyces sp. UNOC14_S4]|uniref:LytR C-terminal domain-containing protein n=1 Tax=Streptomyces sp. UNOC14_S4 TaxID=2872340 RepID=UPI001E64A1DB|nr:LytR C-terminal domain-containing protein [Streptomyces sp. UNOC14_S4]MCC3767674.1 LytR C-terminal domain-containing protein [Streptomyces sp. UNOC14_S4]
MSMLTPPGMGGKYRITGHRFPHMRRPRNRRRIVLAAVSVTAVFALAGWGTLQLVDVFSGGSQDTAQAAHGKGGKNAKGGKGDCKEGADAPKPLPRPDEITVNVYNATPRGGLAKITADELKKRGFRIGKVGNAPELYDKKVSNTGLLLGAAESSDGALKVLGTQLTGTDVRNDQRSGQDVDLILGAEFKELSAKDEADRTLTELGGEPASSEAPPLEPSAKPSSPPAKAAPAAPAARC